MNECTLLNNFMNLYLENHDIFPFQQSQLHWKKFSPFLPSFIVASFSFWKHKGEERERFTFNLEREEPNSLIKEDSCSSHLVTLICT